MAYAAITSLILTLDKFIQSDQRCNTEEMQFLYHKLHCLQSVLVESQSNGDELKSLEAEITEVAYGSEDIIESKFREIRVVEGVHRRRAYTSLGLSLRELAQEIDSMANKLMEIQRSNGGIEDLKVRMDNLVVSSPLNALQSDKCNMVGHCNELDMILEKFASGQSLELNVVSIVGMGGIGKTTLAVQIYCHPWIMQRFDIRAKVTVSQKHHVRDVILGLLSCITGITNVTNKEDDGQLAEHLQKKLKGRKYLILIDDIWTTEAWDQIKLCFPDYDNGSRILLTTRNQHVAEYASLGMPPCHMRLLTFDESCKLFYQRLGQLPIEFQNIGQLIVEKCRGLPLTIVVVAGLLSKLGKALDEWWNIAAKVSLLVNGAIDNQCERVLALSYHYLPLHLKACFLYFGVFPEDSEIRVNRLIRTWVAEGFLKADKEGNFEAVAEKYLDDLVDRNLVVMKSWSFDGKMKTCGIHDMIREVCLRETQRIQFLEVMLNRNALGRQLAKPVHFQPKVVHRLSIQFSSTDNHLRLCNNSFDKVRSVVCFGDFRMSSVQNLEPLCFKNLKVLDIENIWCSEFPTCVQGLFHLRLLAVTLYISSLVPDSIAILRNLQTLIVRDRGLNYVHAPVLSLPSSILSMPHLRYLHLSLNQFRYLGQMVQQKPLALENLHTLSGLNPESCTWSVLEQISHLKKLKIHGLEQNYRDSLLSKFSFVLSDLDKLETLSFSIESFTPGPGEIGSLSPLYLPYLLSFPKNLTKLTFSNTIFSWKYMNVIGKLPKLQALKLKQYACIGEEWETPEGGFRQLKFLLLDVTDFEIWNTSSDHFPRLERLVLRNCYSLDSIPEDFAEITTLQLIEIHNCKDSVASSAKEIQQYVGDNVLNVRVSKKLGFRVQSPLRRRDLYSNLDE